MFKPCASCKSKAKCKKAGKCMKRSRAAVLRNEEEELRSPRDLVWQR